MQFKSASIDGSKRRDIGDCGESRQWLGHLVTYLLEGIHTKPFPDRLLVSWRRESGGQNGKESGAKLPGRRNEAETREFLLHHTNEISINRGLFVPMEEHEVGRGQFPTDDEMC